MVNVTAEHSPTYLHTEYFVSCTQCGWAPRGPFLTVTDVAVRDSDYMPAYIDGRVAQVKASHVCLEPR